MDEQAEWTVWWDKAKELERQVPERKRVARAAIAAVHPEVGGKQYGDLVRDLNGGKLHGDLARLVEEHRKAVAELEAQGRACRQKSDQLLAESSRADGRRWLDPRIDVVPPGPFPKLRQCQSYPLRQSCNNGETAITRWNRCEFMKYDNSRSFNDPCRWCCTAVERPPPAS